MNLTPSTAVGHPLGIIRGVRIREAVIPGVVPAAALLLAGPGTGVASSGTAGHPAAAGAVPWYVPSAATLLAAAVTATATWLTARWNRAQQRRDRRRDRVERMEQQAVLRAEAELREKRAASRAGWAPYFQRVEEVLLAVGVLQREAQQRRLHDDDAAAAELMRLRQAAEQYSDRGPGVLPAALRDLAEAIGEIDRHLLPNAAQLDCITVHASPSAVCMPLFGRAGEQARAADNLGRALKDTYATLHHEWGID